MQSNPVTFKMDDFDFSIYLSVEIIFLKHLNNNILF